MYPTPKTDPQFNAFCLNPSLKKDGQIGGLLPCIKTATGRLRHDRLTWLAGRCLLAASRYFQDSLLACFSLINIEIKKCLNPTII